MGKCLFLTYDNLFICHQVKVLGFAQAVEVVRYVMSICRFKSMQFLVAFAERTGCFSLHDHTPHLHLAFTVNVVGHVQSSNFLSSSSSYWVCPKMGSANGKFHGFSMFFQLFFGGSPIFRRPAAGLCAADRHPAVCRGGTTDRPNERGCGAPGKLRWGSCGWNGVLVDGNVNGEIVVI